jgi:putative MATE family efflux protein
MGTGWGAHAVRPYKRAVIRVHLRPSSAFIRVRRFCASVTPLSGTIAPVSSEPARKESGPRPSAGRDLTTGSIPRHLVAFATPMLAANALQTAYSFVNAFWVGRFLGTEALAAVTVSQPVIFVVIASAAGLTLAGNILVAQYYGAREWDRLRQTVQTSVTLVSIASVLLLVVGQLVVRRLLVAINTPADIFAASVSYLHITLWTIPFAFGIFLIASLLRGIGDSRTPVYFQVISLLLNAILDPLLMFGWLGFPRLGLNGTAWATLTAQVLAVIALFFYLPQRRPLVAPDWRRLQLDRATAWLLLWIGVPSMVQQSVVSVSGLFIVSFVSAFGSTADAAYGAAIRIDGIAFLPALTMGLAVSTLAGQNLGARLFDRVRQTFRWGILLSAGLSALIAAVVIGFPRSFIHIFSTDPEVVAIGAGYLRIVGWTYLLYAVMFASNGIINGSGQTLITTAFSVTSLWGIRLPLAWYLAHRMHSVRGIWWGMLSSVFFGMLFTLAYYATGRWKRVVVRHRRGAGE